jgi:hypothetical protein
VRQNTVTAGCAAGRARGDVWKTCGSLADRMWTRCRRTSFFDDFLPESSDVLLRGASSYAVSLARANRLADTGSGVDTVRFEETINGRRYVIEVCAVDRDRWRAQILRRPGASTALMPFYGATAIEAAGLLSQWLTRAAGASA